MPKSDRPNVLFVFADQLRACSLGHVGEDPVLTPRLDDFAQEGRRLTRAVSNCPLCCPMRASMLTGLHPLSHGIVANDIRLPESAPGIAKSLKGAGYRTGYIGKWHLDGPERSCFTPPGPRRQGFEYWAVANCNHSYYESYYYRDDPEPIWNDGYEPTAQTDIAIRYLEEAGRQPEPFLLMLSWGPPHCPYDNVPERFRRFYDSAALPVRPNAVSPDRRILANYYAHISALDWNFGRLLDALEELGLANDTLVIFTSDHGDMMFSQGRGWKCKPWRESVIVPFIARWPGRVPAGTLETAPFGLVNVMPTLASVCSAAVPPHVNAGAYPEMLLGGDGPRPVSTPIYLYGKATHPSVDVWRGVVTDRHTYARFRSRPWVLYDDVDDPYQLHNLAHAPSATAQREALEAELQRTLAAMDDRFESLEEVNRRFGLDTDSHGIPHFYARPEISEEMARRASTRAARMLKG